MRPWCSAEGTARYAQGLVIATTFLWLLLTLQRNCGSCSGAAFSLMFAGGAVGAMLSAGVYFYWTTRKFVVSRRLIWLHPWLIRAEVFLCLLAVMPVVVLLLLGAEVTPDTRLSALLFLTAGGVGASLLLPPQEAGSSGA